MMMVGTTAVPVSPSAVNPVAASSSGMAVCQRRSRVRSECLPQSTMSTVAMP